MLPKTDSRQNKVIDTMMNSNSVAIFQSVFCWNQQVLGPKPELKESTPEEDSKADASNSASLYKVLKIMCEASVSLPTRLFQITGRDLLCIRSVIHTSSSLHFFMHFYAINVPKILICRFQMQQGQWSWPRCPKKVHLPRTCSYVMTALSWTMGPMERSLFGKVKKIYFFIMRTWSLHVQVELLISEFLIISWFLI